MRSLLFILLFLFGSSFATQCFYQEQIKYDWLMGLKGIHTLFTGGWVKNEAGIEECETGVDQCFTHIWDGNVFRGCLYGGGKCKPMKREGMDYSCCRGDMCNSPVIRKREKFAPGMKKEIEGMKKLKLPAQGIEIELPVIEETRE